MVDIWQRSSIASPAVNPYWGGSPMVTLFPNETVLRSWVNLSVWGLWVNNSYPPGNSMLRAGLIIDSLTAPAGQTPISQENDAWMWLNTLQPTVQFSRATNVAWQIHWGFPLDQSVKAQRKNSGLDEQTLRLAWEFELNGEIPSFSVTGWNGSVDALIRDPDAAFQEGVLRVPHRAT